MVINIVLIDDHAIVRAGFRMLLATEESIEVVAEANRGEEAWQLYVDHRPDVMVVDLSMPGMGGFETIRRICNKAPEAKILAFSVHDELVYVNRVMAAGAKGYICKNSAPDVLIPAIKHIAMGGIYVDPVFGMASMQEHASYKAIIANFSTREFDIFLRLAKGLTAHKIAEELCLGYKTVANYGTQIRNKLKVNSAAELAHIALLSGILKN